MLTDGDVRMDLYSHTLQVFYNGQWGTVCGDYFNSDDYRAVCRMLGYRYLFMIKYAQIIKGGVAHHLKMA